MQRLLIVDDEQPMLNALSRMLRDEWAVTTSNVVPTDYNCDVALVDLMPHGRQVGEELQRRGIPFLIFTCCPRWCPPGWPCLEKPADKETIEKKLWEVLKK